MVGKDAGFVKTTRLKSIKCQMAQSISKGVDKDRVLDWVELNIGLSRSTATKYVDLIVRSEGWIDNDGTIVYELAEVQI